MTVVPVAMDGIQRDFRRYELALRLMTHRVRTHTISLITALSRHQLATLRRRWGVKEQWRHRGPPPTSLDAFTHSSRARSEAAVLAVYCRLYNAIPRRGSAAGAALLSLELCERLCDAYEAFHACFPDSTVEFESLLSLVFGLAQGERIGLSQCALCQGIILVDLLGAPRRRCSICHESEATGAVSAPPLARPSRIPNEAN